MMLSQQVVLNNLKVNCTKSKELTFRLGFFYTATLRPLIGPTRIPGVYVLLCVRVGVVNGRGFILILANAPSQNQGRFYAPGHAGMRQGSGPRQPAQTDRTV